MSQRLPVAPIPDLQLCAPWIQKQHLRPESASANRTAFLAHPARILHLPDVLHPHLAQALARFLAEGALFHTEYSLLQAGGGDAVADADQWNAAPQDQRFYRFGLFAGTRQQGQISPDLFTFLKFRTALGDDPIRTFFSTSTGLNLGTLAFAAHKMQHGDFLKPHTDNVRNRRIAFVFYLSDHWQDDCGGELHIVHFNREVTIIRPLYNSLVIFDVRAHLHHFIPPIPAAAGPRARLTIGGWYQYPPAEV